jgi:hypothetical protein
MMHHLLPILAQFAALLLLVTLILLSRWFFRKGWPRRIALSGYFLPVLVGICVRQYLQSIGKPVMAWRWILSWFYNPGQLIVLVLLLAYWDVPFLIVAAIAGKWQMDDKRHRILVYSAFFGTILFTLVVFGNLWKNTEAVVMMAPVIPLYVLPGTLLGIGIGWILRLFTHETNTKADS